MAPVQTTKPSAANARVFNDASLPAERVEPTSIVVRRWVICPRSSVQESLPYVCPTLRRSTPMGVRPTKNPAICRVFVLWAILGSKEKIGVI
jgi:hypothetical protein